MQKSMKGLLALALAACVAVPLAYAAGQFEAYPTGTAPLTGSETIPADTNLSGGQTPQTEKVTTETLKNYIVGGNIANPSTRTATASAGAATLNSGYGVVTSEALTTAAGAVYTLTLTNSAIAATDVVLVTVGNGTNTTVGPSLAGVTPAAGSVTIVVRNTHASSALNGTIKVAFSVIKG